MSKPVLEDLFRFSGRRNRKSYLLCSLVYMAGLAVLAAFFSIAMITEDETVQALVWLGCLVVLVPLSISVWAVSSQRCRDFGWTGWAVLITLVPYVGWLFSIAMIFIPGNIGPNRYGPDPIAGAVEVEVRRRIEPLLGEVA